MKITGLFESVRFRNEAHFINTETVKLVDEIIDLMYRIKGEKNTGRYLWVMTERGTFEEYKTENPADEIETEEEFLSCFPDKVSWIPISCIKTDYCRFVKICSMAFDLRNDTHIETGSYGSYAFILEPIIVCIKEALEMMKNGTYNDFVQRELPYELRYGTISRKEFWAVDQEDKQGIIADLTESEIEEFISILEEENQDEIPSNLIKDMTFNKYFAMGIKCHESVGFFNNKGTLGERFFSRGEDFGGRVVEELNHDSIQEFEDFLTGKIKNMGGHPWGIFRGSSRSRITLLPRETDNGYYFDFMSNPNWSVYESVKSYLALKKENYPVRYRCPEEIIRYLREEDLVGFVSRLRLAVYCQNCFDEPVEDFRHFDMETHKALIDKIKWQPLNNYFLED